MRATGGIKKNSLGGGGAYKTGQGFLVLCNIKEF